MYIITPTYRRPEQIAEITRLGYTLKHVTNLFWLVIEDATAPTASVTKQLNRIGVPFAHLTGKHSTGSMYFDDWIRFNFSSVRVMNELSHDPHSHKI